MTKQEREQRVIDQLARNVATSRQSAAEWQEVLDAYRERLRERPNAGQS
jgi:hypothetical protein